MHHKVKIKQSINSYMLIREIGVLTFIYLLQKTGLGLVNTEYLHLHPWCLRTKAYNAVHLKLNVWKPNDEYSLKNNPSLDSRERERKRGGDRVFQMSNHPTVRLMSLRDGMYHLLSVIYQWRQEASMTDWMYVTSFNTANDSRDEAWPIKIKLQNIA